LGESGAIDPKEVIIIGVNLRRACWSGPLFAQAFQAFSFIQPKSCFLSRAPLTSGPILLALMPTLALPLTPRGRSPGKTWKFPAFDRSQEERLLLFC
jgi:hypothetical protein